MNKRFQLIMAICFAIIISSCNNSADSAKEPAKDTTKATDTVAAKPAPPPPVFTPFDVLEVEHAVKDYAAWRPGFNEDSVARKASGLTEMVVGRANSNPKNLFIVLGVADRQKAKDFGASPHLKEAMKKVGVVSKPVVTLFHVIRFDGTSKEKQWVVVTHKVKDFDAWLKVFDAEGTANRASQGLIDVALARGVADSSLVQIVFDIKDLAKAKASIGSEEKKKLMTSAGVVGVPKIQFYTTAE